MKSREQRKKEEIELRKEKKQRTKEAIDHVASSKPTVEKHRHFMEEEKEKDRLEKLQRKRELHTEHIRARNDREESAKRKTAESIVVQKEVIQMMTAEHERETARAKEIQRLIEKEQAELAKTAPRNVHISIHRTDAINEQRAGLPVLREEQPIVEAITTASRSCVLICGETGSGKTTQVPQFLWEAGFGHPEGGVFGREGCILVTEPRRVAAVSMARRVAEELNVGFGEEVCYHVRYDNNLSDSFKLKFATEGIVLKEVQSDFLLKRYSVIVIDEAHERSISCDLLIGLLSRIVPLRNDLFKEELAANNGDITKTKVKPLKLVIMSATMRVTDFKDNRTLFPITPQLINVEARRFPVTNHFARKTELKEYVDEAFHKVRQIHKKLPPGGILVFLCTQQEIEDLCARLRQHYARTKIEYYDSSYSKHKLLTGKDEEETRGSSVDSDASPRAGAEAAAEKEEETEEKDEYGLQTKDYALDDDEGGKEAALADVAEGWGRGDGKRDRTGKREDDQHTETEGEVNGEYDTLHVLPLYALLDFYKQQEVFKPPPPGTRLCVVATNVAETSITIPNVKYVIDAGRVKTKVLDSETQASCYRIEWTSQASAEQRSGRAGRVGPGHCYRLYSTAVYSNLMPKHSLPEILRTPLDAVVLLMKHVGIEHVGAFPFPSPPREEDLKKALRHLVVIGALDATAGYRITELGRQLVSFPVPPRFARAIAEAHRRGCSPRLVDYVLGVVAVSSTTTTVFTGEGNQIKASKQDEQADPRREGIRSLVNAGSDLMTYLNAFLVYNREPRACREYCLVQKSLYEAKMLFHQLRSLSRQHRGGADDVVDSLDANETWIVGDDRVNGGEDGRVVSRADEIPLRQLFIPGLLDQVARRATVHECRSLGAEYNDKKTSRTPYLITSTRTIAFIHPTSTVSRTFPPPEYVTFAFLQRVVRSESKQPQTAMLGVTVVTKEWLNQYDFDEETVYDP